MSNEIPLKQVIDATLENLKNIMSTDTVIGEPKTVLEDTVIIPVSKVSMGFASGGSGFGNSPQKDNFGGGAGGGIKISPVAFLVVTDGNVRLISVSESPDQLDKIFTKIPEVIDQVSGLINKNKKSEEA